MNEERIPIFSVTNEMANLKNKMLDAIENVLMSGHFIMGENVKALETELAAYLGVKHTIAVNSGTDALLISLKAAGIGPGDEVITTPFTFFATAEAIHQAGARAVFVDIDPVTFNIDPTLIKAAITPKTKAIMPVHIFGQVAEMEAILETAKQHGFMVFEDVAQAFGAEHKGKKAGTLGTAGSFSFFPTKNLGAYGDGGLIATNDNTIAESSRMLRAHGSKKKYHNETFGYNSRLDEIQAAILRVKLPYINEWNLKRIRIAKRYSEALGHIPGITTPPLNQVNSNHVFHQYTIRISDEMRDTLQAGLTKLGIDTMVYYPIPVHKLPVYEGMNISLPIAEKAALEVLSLPMWPGMEESIQQRVIDSIISIMRK